MTTIRSTLWLRTGSVSAQMANETNLCAEESWAVRIRNGGAFSKFPAQLSCCVPSCFTDTHSTSDTFMPLVSVLRQIFHTIWGDTERFHGHHPCVFKALSLASLGAPALTQFAAEHFLQEVVIFHADNMTGPTKLWLHQDGVDSGKKSSSKIFGVGDVFFSLWYRESSSVRSCESGLASF